MPFRATGGEDQPHSNETVTGTLLEANFPYVEVSRLVAADRRASDPAYQAHRWFARRPPALIRAALLASVTESCDDLTCFWDTYAAEERPLAGLSVIDPFMGGGTTLLEAARLGADVDGQDVDPMSVQMNQHLLDPPSAEQVREAGDRLREYLRAKLGHLWPARDDDGAWWLPLHYFTLARVVCPACHDEDLLYRTPVLARSVGKSGAVVRDAEVSAFCPRCHEVHDLQDGQHEFVCCESTWDTGSGTFRAGRYRCPACGTTSTHEQLATGGAERVLVAVEETLDGSRRGRRRIRSATPQDQVEAPVVDHPGLGVKVEVGSDARPVSFGMTRVRDLHTDRQLAYLTYAMAWVDENVDDESLARALRLAVSTSITSNNRLCGYATDYGRLAPLFSVRAFSLPALTVELNPLHPHAGRGTLAASLARVASSCSSTVRRHVLRGDAAEPVTLTLGRTPGGMARLADSVHAVTARRTADLCLTDPPYFDFIPYDTLSQIFRVWLAGRDLAGVPVLPAGLDPVKHFSELLGDALHNAAAACQPGAIVAFTFKGSQQGWDAVAAGLGRAGLRVTGLWPVLADPGMGHHSGAGNCEYDMLVVCRPEEVTECETAPFDADVWCSELHAWRPLSEADRQHVRLAATVLSKRRGVRTSASP